MTRTINNLLVKVIERTENPLAPFIMQEAYGSANALGKMMASMATKDEVNKMIDDLLANFNPSEIDEIAKNPNYICALCSMLASALVAYGNQEE